MLEEIDRIVVFPTYLELHLNLSRMIGMTELELLPEGNQECIRIEYENLFNYKENKAEEREQIIELLKEKPDSTAVSIAETLGFTLSATHYRMNVLKKEGRIKYHREGQSGYWEVKKAEISFRMKINKRL